MYRLLWEAPFLCSPPTECRSLMPHTVVTMCSSTLDSHSVLIFVPMKSIS